jgi:hypothetical protein
LFLFLKDHSENGDKDRRDIVQKERKTSAGNKEKELWETEIDEEKEKKGSPCASVLCYTSLLQ